MLTVPKELEMAENVENGKIWALVSYDAIGNDFPSPILADTFLQSGTCVGPV